MYDINFLFGISVLFILDVHCIYILQVLEPSKEPAQKSHPFELKSNKPCTV